MKSILVFGCFLFSLFPGVVKEGYSQFYIAGQHHAADYYVDPDTTLTGPNNHFSTLPPAIFPIDINGDDIVDFSLFAAGSWTNGWGDSEISIRIHDTSMCQIAFGYYDTCHTPNSTYFLYKIANPLKLNDTIDRTLDWLNSKMYFTYTNWGAMVYNCDYNGFVNDPLGNYIAVRMNRPNDTIYGWIKITNVGFLTFTVQEYACNKNCSGLDELNDFVNIYPVPATGIISVKTLIQDAILTVFNDQGVQVMKIKLMAGKNMVDLSSNPGGIYIFKISGTNGTVIRKVIKQL